MDATVRAEIDAALVRLADGDRSAFDHAFTALWPIVLALSIRLLGSTVEAEDAAQEAMYKVFSRINELQVDRSGVTWALGSRLGSAAQDEHLVPDAERMQVKRRRT